MPLQPSCEKGAPLRRLVRSAAAAKPKSEWWRQVGVGPGRCRVCRAELGREEERVAARESDKEERGEPCRKIWQGLGNQ
ncbi:hypothetical protein E2C01_082307 [Portunus trituberculatus]|uniref:Uncharacterized protein n=1 Tax=Portunus trituberculatus TaxID=210409 RepID=A0A5B7IY35_PORTR|nr:hypothetical protein [Portunus trituberculatus]